MPYYPNTHSAKQKSPALSRAFEIVARRTFCTTNPANADFITQNISLQEG